MSRLIPPHSHKSYLGHPEDRNFLSGSMKGSKFRMYPEVFRAPDRLPNQTLRITEVGCTIHHDSEYPCETSICMMGTSHVSKSHQNILLPRARKPHVQALKRGISSMISSLSHEMTVPTPYSKGNPVHLSLT